MWVSRKGCVNIGLRMIQVYQIEVDKHSRFLNLLIISKAKSNLLIMLDATIFYKMVKFHKFSQYGLTNALFWEQIFYQLEQKNPSYNVSIIHHLLPNLFQCFRKFKLHKLLLIACVQVEHYKHKAQSYQHVYDKVRLDAR